MSLFKPPKIEILGSSAVAIPNTGNTNENTLASVLVPGGAIGLNGILRITHMWSMTNNGNNKTPRIRFASMDGTGINYFGAAFTATVSARMETQIQNRNALNSQVGNASSAIGIYFSTAALITTAIDTSVDQTLKFTAQCANGADTLTLESYLVELIRMN